jgi:hypothetical protein
MSIRDFIHDLAVRFVVLGWIYAQKPLKWAPKGHNFQPNPPVQVGRRSHSVLLSAGYAMGLMFACFTLAGVCQYHREVLNRMS